MKFKWININNQKPPTQINVLIWSVNRVTIGFYTYDHSIMGDFVEEYSGYLIPGEYWMSLPEGFNET